MEEAGEAAGNGMQQEDQVENTWSEIQELANNVIKNNATHGLPHKLIKIKLKENSKQDTLLSQETISNLIPEIPDPRD